MAKGSANERIKCKEWSLWWTDGNRDDIFWRTSGSGARAKVRSRAGKKTAGSYGDLTAIDSVGEPLVRKCTIEFKKGYNKTLDLLSLLDSKGKKQTLRDFLNQVKVDSENAGTFPILEIHRDYRQPVVLLEQKLYRELVNYYGEVWFEYMILVLCQGKYVMMRRSDFFDWCSPEFFHDEWIGRAYTEDYNQGGESLDGEIST